MGLYIAISVVWRQFHQIVEHVHDWHHCEHSLLVVGLMLVVSFGEWLRIQLGLSTQPVQLHFDVIC
jgi:hypothetical protein